MQHAVVVESFGPWHCDDEDRGESLHTATEPQLCLFSIVDRIASSGYAKEAPLSLFRVMVYLNYFRILDGSRPSCRPQCFDPW